MTEPAPPRGFIRLGSAAAEIIVDEAHADAVVGLGLLEPGGLVRALSGETRLSGRSAVALLAFGDGQTLCLRPLRRGGILAPLRRGGWPDLGRPLRELAVTAQLRLAGAPVPRPLVVAGARRTDGRFDAAFGTRFEPGASDSLAALVAPHDASFILRAARAAGSAVRRFHDCGGRHADLHVKNLLLRETAGEIEAIVIDLDRARIAAPVSPRARLAEIMRLWRSVVKRGIAERVGARGRAEFLEAYTAGDREFRRVLLAGLGFERLRLAVHSLHYRSGFDPRNR